MTKGCFCSCLAGLMVLLLPVIVLLALLFGLLAAFFGSGNGSGGAGTSEIAQYASEMAQHLHNGGAYGFDVVMDSGFPKGAIDFWDSVCGYPGCAWNLSGDLQCGQFVGMAYGWAGLPLVDVNVVLEWWNVYENGAQPGWIEIGNGTGMPQPGDIVIFATPPGPFFGEGHAGIVTSVQPSIQGGAGSLTFAEANGPTQFVTMPLAPDGALVPTWSGYTVMGFIRHLSA
jgi:hypothetical protein